MQDKRIAEKAIELNRLQMEALLKFGPESLANLKFLQKQNAQVQKIRLRPSHYRVPGVVCNGNLFEL